MRILEVEIHNFRGIRHLLLEPNGKNVVVWGSNGSGKSAVVDALDFLLTGEITRLSGRGSAALLLSKHGPHIDCTAKDATVRAIIQLPGVAEPIEVKRSVASPGTLECDGSAKQYLNSITDLARRGVHILTRREILRFITTEPSHRAEQIQELLNIKEIEHIRKALVSVVSGCKKDVKSAERSLTQAKGNVNATLLERTYREEAVLEAVNHNRGLLGGKPASTIQSDQLKAGLTPPAGISDDYSKNLELARRDIQNLQDAISTKSQEKVAEDDKRLRSLIETVKSDPELRRSLSRLQLINQGLKLIDESGSCPLCDTPWPTDGLRTYLEQRLLTATRAEQYRKDIHNLSQSVSDSVNRVASSLRKVIVSAWALDLKGDLALLQGWLDDLDVLSSLLNKAIEKYPDARIGADQVQRLLAPADLENVLVRVSAAIQAQYPEATPEQTAWDTLTRLGENLKVLERAQQDTENANICYQRACALHNSFERARDSVLGGLYEEIKDRFVELYRYLHRSDEGKFDAKIESEGAGLNLEVDFYGRGAHPPHALHSEGHQDSMGLCLFLALSERLTGRSFDLVILDDVVMSVDSEHRREVCRLLSTHFENRQFLITTHDRMWANQLKTEGVVNANSTIHFYNWTVSSGPQVNHQVDLWERIGTNLQYNNVPAAAFTLRRGLEEFFSAVCDALAARVIYRENGRWGLGDFLPAATSQYRALLRKAKDAAQSRNEKEILKILGNHDMIVGEIFSNSQVEQWAINPNVHFNLWADFSIEDFIPVVEGFQRLCSLFQCDSCGSMIRVLMNGDVLDCVRCNCAKMFWNLTRDVAIKKSIVYTN